MKYINRVKKKKTEKWIVMKNVLKLGRRNVAI